MRNGEATPSVSWDTNALKESQSRPEQVGIAAGDDSRSMESADSEKAILGFGGTGRSDVDVDGTREGLETAQVSSSEEDDKKLADLSSKLWRSPSWGSHSAPSSPRHVYPRIHENSSHQSVPFPLTPHPQHAAQQRSAVHKPPGDDRRDWAPPTPGRRCREMNSRFRNGLDIKLDLGAVQRARDANEPTETQLKRDKFAFFDKDCSWVAEHIYIGSDAVARNRETLLANKITHVLNCVGFVCPECFPDDFKYKTLWLQDSPCEDITSILYDVFDYFEDVRMMGGRVFVHCCQGVSRSTSLVIAYLMWRKGRSFEDAFHDVKTARGVTNPNMGFACQLLQCQKRVHAAPASPNSVLRMYRMAPHSPYDPLHLVPKTVINPGVAALDSRGAFVVHIPSAIYVWVGKHCEEGMVSAAKTAVNQVVKYERAQGKISLIHDGDEPSEFWEALDKGSGPFEGSEGNFVDSISKNVPATCLEKLSRISGAHEYHSNNVQQFDPSRSKLLKEADCQSDKKLNSQFGGMSSCKSTPGSRIVEDYSYDYDVYRIALVGGVVPPSNGLATHVPARDSGWGKIIKSPNSLREVASSKTSSSEINSQSLKSANPNLFDERMMTRDLLDMSKNAEILSDLFPSHDVASSFSHSTSLVPSPSVSAGSTSSPCFTTDTPSTESSLSDSPSSESRSPAFRFLFSNSLRIDHLHAQLGPKPPQKTHPSSLAARRGSTPPSLRLPALIEDLSTPKSLSASTSSPSLGSAKKQKEVSFLSRRGSVQYSEKSPNLSGIMDLDIQRSGVNGISENQVSEGAIATDLKCSETQMPRRGSDMSTKPAWHKTFYSSKQNRQPEMYAWPSMKKVDFSLADLDSRATFVLIAPFNRLPKNMPDMNGDVYVWVGKNVAQTEETSVFVDNIDHQQPIWGNLSKGLSEYSQLHADMPIKVVKEGSEPDEFWDLFVEG